jgi:hypothetical protein
VFTDRSDRKNPIDAGAPDTEDDTADSQLFIRSELDADPTHITLQVRSERLTRRLERVWQALEHLPVLVHRKRTDEIRADLFNALKTAEDLVLTSRAVAADTCLAGAAADSRHPCGPGAERLRVIIQHADRTAHESGQPGCPTHVAEQLTLLHLPPNAAIVLDGPEPACRETVRRTLAAFHHGETIPDWLADYAQHHRLGVGAE